MELQLQRPLVFFDLETTGTDKTKDRITQFCFHTFQPDGSNSVYDRLVNPGQPIPENVAALTGISNETVKDLFGFDAYAESVHAIINGADLVGFGCLLFDVPVLFAELLRCGIIWDYTQCNIIDAGNIFKRQVPRDLTAAFEHYTGQKMIGAHNAAKDVEATRSVFLFQLQKHQLTGDMRSLALYSNFDKALVDLSGKFSIDEDGDVVFNFSAQRGQKAKYHISLLYWVLEKDFTEDVKIICRRLIEQYTNVSAPISDGLPF